MQNNTEIQTERQDGTHKQRQKRNKKRKNIKK